MRSFRTFSLFAALLLPAAAHAQCAAGLVVNCPSAVSPQPTDLLYLWQPGQTPHSRKVRLIDAISGGAGVTSVGLSAPSIFGVSGSPVTSTGTLALSLASQAANTVLVAPNGAGGTPAFRSLVGPDLPLSIQEVALTLGWSGVPAASTVSSGPSLLWPCVIPANFAVSQGYANGTPTGSPAFSVSYVHAGLSYSIGTATFSPGSNYPAFSTSSSVSLAAGDSLVGTSPATPDATAADVSLSIMCKRS